MEKDYLGSNNKALRWIHFTYIFTLLLLNSTYHSTIYSKFPSFAYVGVIRLTAWDDTAQCIRLCRWMKTRAPQICISNWTKFVYDTPSNWKQKIFSNISENVACEYIMDDSEEIHYTQVVPQIEHYYYYYNYSVGLYLL